MHWVYALNLSEIILYIIYYVYMHWLHNSGALPRIVRFLSIIALILIFTPLISMFVYMFPRTIESGHTPEIFDLEYEEVSFYSSEGLELRGWFIPSERGEEGSPTIVFLHGYPAEKGDLITFAYPYHDSYNILLFDFRGLGESDGRISTLGYKEAEDVKTSVEYLKKRGLDRIGVWGFSMGAAAVLLSAKDLDYVDAIVADSSYASITDMSREVFENLTPGGSALGDLQMLWARAIFWIDPADISPERAVMGIQQPLLLSHLPGDTVIPISQAEKLKDAAEGKDNVSFWIHDSATHGLMSVEYQKYVRSFFDKNLIEEETI